MERMERVVEWGSSDVRTQLELANDAVQADMRRVAEAVTEAILEDDDRAVGPLRSTIREMRVFQAAVRGLLDRYTAIQAGEVPVPAVPAPAQEAPVTKEVGVPTPHAPGRVTTPPPGTYKTSADMTTEMFKVMLANPRPLTAVEMRDILAKRVAFSPEDQERISTGQPRWYSQLATAAARQRKKGNLVNSPRFEFARSGREYAINWLRRAEEEVPSDETI